MYYLYIVTALALFVSLVVDRKKTAKAFMIAVKRLLKILPAFMAMLVFVSIFLYIVPDALITRYLGNRSTVAGFISAMILGSVTIMPGFMVYPLCGILLQKHITYMVLSAFSTTLMMVGVLTFAVEKEYFGIKVAVVRNIISLFIAVFVAIVTGLLFGELPWQN